jgi:DNA modification methylase
VNEYHPTQKPIEVAMRAMRNSSEHGNIVWDGFLGSGTTMVAAENLRRKCYGIEISPDYCAVILERMATAFPALAIERA